MRNIKTVFLLTILSFSVYASGAKLRQVALIDLPGSPGFNQVTMANGQVVISRPGTNTIEIFSPVKRRVVARISQISDPRGMAMACAPAVPSMRCLVRSRRDEGFGAPPHASIPQHERETAVQPVIETERPDTPDARALITELESLLASLYPSESRHGYSIGKLLSGLL